MEITTVGYIKPLIATKNSKGAAIKLNDDASNFNETFYEKQLIEEQPKITYYKEKPLNGQYIIEAYVPWTYRVYGDELYSYPLHTFYLVTYENGAIIKSVLVAKYLSAGSPDKYEEHSDYLAFKEKTIQNGYELNKVSVVSSLNSSWSLKKIKKSKNNLAYDLTISDAGTSAGADTPLVTFRDLNVPSLLKIFVILF